METTYGDRLHRPLDQTVEEFYGAVSDCFRRGGNVVIPTFALERAQEVLYYLREGVDRQRACPGDPGVPRFADGDLGDRGLQAPSGVPARRILRSDFRGATTPCGRRGCISRRETADSIAINQVTGGAVILAGSGMCTGGRVLHHLRHNLGRPASAIVFVGYAAEGTLARKIIDGAQEVTDRRRPHPGPGAHSHDQRLLGPRRSGGPHRMARKDQRQAHVPDTR